MKLQPLEKTGDGEDVKELLMGGNRKQISLQTRRDYTTRLHQTPPVRNSASQSGNNLIREYVPHYELLDKPCSPVRSINTIWELDRVEITSVIYEVQINVLFPPKKNKRKEVQAPRVSNCRLFFFSLSRPTTTLCPNNATKDFYIVYVTAFLRMISIP